MKKLLFGAVCFALLFAFGTSLEAAECGTDALFAPIMSTQPPVQTPDAAPQELGALVAAGLVDTTAIHTSDFDFEICQWWACYQTPTGCGCAGFYCNGRFICGYRIKVK